MCNTEAHELVLFINNDGHLYVSRHAPIIQNLCRHIAKGRYDRNEALKSYLSLAIDGAKMYCQRHCGPDARWNTIFSVESRKIAAEELLSSFESEYRCNKHEGINPVSEDKRLDLD